MTQLAITVFGRDRPGIIADLTGALAGLGMNIEDSTMTLLRGHFAMMLIASTGEISADEVMDRIAPSMLAREGLSVSVDLVRQEAAAPTSASYLLSVHGGDRPGIVSALLAEVAAVGGNVTDLTTRLVGELYVLSAECDLPAAVDLDRLDVAVRRVADEVGVSATLRPLESDDL
jgi:glycine cleavage system transcriptional repressor